MPAMPRPWRPRRHARRRRRRCAALALPRPAQVPTCGRAPRTGTSFHGSPSPLSRPVARPELRAPEPNRAAHRDVDATPLMLAVLAVVVASRLVAAREPRPRPRSARTIQGEFRRPHGTAQCRRLSGHVKRRLNLRGGDRTTAIAKLERFPGASRWAARRSTITSREFPAPPRHPGRPADGPRMRCSDLCLN